jgi:hypothetical protein
VRREIDLVDLGLKDHVRSETRADQRDRELAEIAGELADERERVVIFLLFFFFFGFCSVETELRETIIYIEKSI